MSSPNHYRMQLNNLLQANGGTGRLHWGEPIKGGFEHSPTWTVIASLDGMEYGRGTRGTLGAAKEEAARQVLRRLSALNFTN
ncbi:hypothetical protein BDM02DRAFT_3108587 [Thelephora ganbajun]|uniref:Uncharacterized protein n=1 Tax=Thelephora ganbajun TaxID=370292 RepID=A0ACB6ZU83_THEGA|nr:hypothetical protein BDM02DRAFT_3108587 [Thelephora ganbajun]